MIWLLLWQVWCIVAWALSWLKCISLWLWSLRWLAATVAAVVVRRERGGAV